MVIVSINSQKASNRPEIQCQLYFMRNKPSKENIENVKNLEIISSIKAEYFEDQVGVNIFILVKNRYGGGKSINIKISAEFEIQNPDVSIINRDYKLDYLDTGDAVALYVTKFENPSESTSIKLNKCFVEFTDPFMEASKEKKYTLLYDKTNQIVAKGDDINEINISEGIRT